MWIQIGRATSTPLILGYSTRFTRPVWDDRHRRLRSQSSVSTSLACWPRLHPKPRLPPSRERRGSFPAWPQVRTIAWHWLLAPGAPLPGSKWPVPGFASTHTRWHRAMMPWTVNPSLGYPCNGRPSAMAPSQAQFMWATASGMPVLVASLDFHLLELPRLAMLPVCSLKAQFACFPTSPTPKNF